jgi:hypothetical protein
LTFAVWIIAIATHEARAYAGPAWLAIGSSSTSRPESRGEGLLERSSPRRAPRPAGAEFSKILVPMKLGEIRRRR